MPAKWHKYSYSARIEERRSIMSLLILVLVLTISFAVIHNNLINMEHIESSTMEPTFTSGDSVITTPLYSTKLVETKGFSFFISPKHGDLVLLSPAFPAKHGYFLDSISSIMSFLTFQKIHLFAQKNSAGEQPMIRRLVAFPGDSIYMENFILHVKTAGSTHYLTEFEVSEHSYDIKLDKLPDNWTKDLPFSSSFDEFTLGTNQYFMLCDNRITASDSRVWGSVSADRIKGKVLFKYWPIGHAGML